MDPFSAKAVLPGLCAYLGVAGGGGVAAALLFFWRQRGKPLLPLPRLRWGRWTGSDILLSLIMLYLAHFVVLAILQETNFLAWLYGPDNAKTRQPLWLSPLALPVFLVFVFMGLYSMSRTYPVDVGLSRSRWSANLLVGYAGFVVATPVVLFLHLLLTTFMEVKTHQFVDVVKGDMSVLDWSLLFVSATVAAPITEELLFRGLIQGWLRRASPAGHATLIALIVLTSWKYSLEFKEGADNAKDLYELVDSFQTINWSRIAMTIGLGLLYVAWLLQVQSHNLFLTEADFQPAESLPEEPLPDPREKPVGAMAANWQTQDTEQQRRKSGLAIFGSALAFALVHPSWPDPVPLLLLGLILGWITQRTQNLLPAIVMHSLFNAVAAFTLLFQTMVAP